MEDVRVTRLINGPEAFTPDGEFCLGETAGPRAVRRRRVLRARARRRGRDRQGDGRVDRRGRAVAGPLAHGRPPLRRPLPLAALHAGPHARGLRDLLRHQVPQPRAAGGAAAAALARVRRGTPRTGPCSARRRAGSGSTGTRPTRRRATRRCARAAGRGATGRRRSAPSARACRETAALFDESSFAKLEVSGPDAAAFLERLTANRVAREPGKVTYTQMLNRRGGIECDFTVTRFAEDRFGIVTGTAFGGHDLAWIAAHVAPDDDVRVADVTSQWACFALWGPRARAILSGCTPGRPRPSRTCRARTSRSATCRCARCG